MIEEFCGNGIVDPGEQCDLGPENGVTGICKNDCSYEEVTCSDLVSYWRFEEEVNNVLYDLEGFNHGSLSTASRAYSIIESEFISFDQSSDYSILPLPSQGLSEGSLVFQVLPFPMSSMGKRVVTNDMFTVDLVASNAPIYDEKTLHFEFGPNPGSRQVIDIDNMHLNVSWYVVSVGWDQSTFYAYVFKPYGPQYSSVPYTGAPFTVNGDLTLGYDSSSTGSFLGFVDEFAIYSRMFQEWDIVPYRNHTVGRDENSSLCGKKTCGDASVNGFNSLGVSEYCDSALEFGSLACSKPGTLVSGLLNDCKDITGGGVYCGNGIVESGEVCDPPGSVGNYHTVNCGTFTLNNIPSVCSPDCKEWVDGDVCGNNNPECGDGFIDPNGGYLSEVCDPPGSLGDPILVTCYDKSFTVPGICVSNCSGFNHPYYACDDEPGGTGGAVCFLAGTPIETPEGVVAIEDLVVGDVVNSYDLDNEIVDSSDVVSTFKRKTEEYYKVSLGDKIISVTGEHPIFIVDNGWTMIKDVSVGDMALSIEGLETRVNSIVGVNEEVDVYNIEVEGNHNYFADEILFHNKQPMNCAQNPNADLSCKAAGVGGICSTRFCDPGPMDDVTGLFTGACNGGPYHVLCRNVHVRCNNDCLCDFAVPGVPPSCLTKNNCWPKCD